MPAAVEESPYRCTLHPSFATQHHLNPGTRTDVRLFTLDRSSKRKCEKDSYRLLISHHRYELK